MTLESTLSPVKTQHVDAQERAPDQSTKSGDGIETCRSKEGLAGINDPGTELVIWQRTLPSRLREWIEQTDASSLPEIRILVEPDQLRRALEPLLDECGLPADEMRDLLLDDIHDLVCVFSDIADCDLVDIRLERVEHDGCWKFHRDTVETRLLTTYRGQTTEWVQPAYAGQAIHGQKHYDGPLERLGLHDVAIFKGRCAGDSSGIVHRSPPIEGTGCTRLLLCLNKQTIVSPAPWADSR